MDLTILEQNKPVIITNFDLVKADLVNGLKEYENLVVTEQSLTVCKQKRTDLASLSISIDKKRKEIKKEFSEPIVEFEGKCKELIELIDNVKGNIDEGIKVFDDKTREEKKQFAIKCINEIGNEFELRENYFRQIQLQERYCNLSITQKEVVLDIRSQALALKNSQLQEDLRRSTAESTIALLNETLNLTNKLTVDEFKVVIECTDSEPEVVAEIVKKEAQKRKDIEEKAVLEAQRKKEEQEALEKEHEEIKIIDTVGEVEDLEESLAMSEPELISDFEKSLLEEEPILTATLEIKATKEQMNKLVTYLGNNSIKYKKV